MADGFIGRWSQRKQAVREGLPLEEPSPPSVSEPAIVTTPEPVNTAPLAEPGEEASPPVEVPPAPTLQDVQGLTPQSDFQRFVASDVDPDVKHAAMRKLFEDPHFNVMDGLDIYIDDYSQPDPLPASMLRQMASAHFLGVGCEELKPQSVAAVPPSSASRSAESVAEVSATPAGTARQEPEETQDHDHTDLRLQQDHATGPEGSGHGAG
jgi:hypothetical protein